jgi:hypothetical protein
MSGGERRWDGEESAERLVNAADHLERAYGRMLRWYPAGHQARHADEMLGVLMASAGPGRHRPGLADSADLIGGALRIRFRAATTGSAGLWREALGRAGVLLPLAWVVLLATLDGPGIARLWVSGGAAGTFGPPELTEYAQFYLPPLAVLITVLLRWRPVALAAIATAVVFGPGDLELRYLVAPWPEDAAYLAVLGIAAVALIAVPERPRLTWRHYVLTVAAAAAAGVAEQQLQSLLANPPYSLSTHGPAGWPAAELAGLAVDAAVTVILLVSSAVSRRLLIVAAVPLYFYVVILVETPGLYLASPLLDLPLVAVTGVAVLLAGRRARAWGRRAAARDRG